jgi:sugar lactone lactonase YvrE/predicted RNA-binding Zn-ribbon protein involved in translation (DUF1610 family)
MIQILKCPSCGAPVEFEDESDRATFRCPFCNNTVVIPDSMRRRAEQEAPQVIVSTFGQRPGRTIRVKPSSVLVPILVVIVLFVGIAFAAVYYSVRGFKRGVDRTVSGVANIPTLAPPPKGAPISKTGSSFATVVMQFGSEGTGPGYFKDARSIAVDGDGRIYVGEYSGGRIQVFDAAGKFITQWVADQQMPLRGLAADRKGTVYVVQRGDIQMFEGPTGKPLGRIGYPEGNNFDDVVATPDGGLVASWHRHRDDIVRLDSAGKVTRVIRAAISGQTERSELSMRVAADGAGNVFALGRFNDAVFKFSPEGRFLNQFGSSGDQTGQFRAPGAITADNQGRVYVADFKGVQVFAPDGRYLDFFPVEGSASGMVFNDRNEIFVVARTQVFKLAVK